MRRFLVPLALICALSATSCGSGSRSVSGGVAPGPALLVLPVFPDGALKTLVLRNFADATAPCRVTWAPLGGPTSFVDLAIDPLAEEWVAIPFFHGWIVVDSRDPITALAILTTGFIEPFLWSTRSGPDVETVPSATLNNVESIIPIHPRTSMVSLYNHDPAPATYTVCAFDTDGSLTSVVLHLVPGNDSELLTDFSTLPNGVGHLSIIPPGTFPFFAIASQDDEDLVYDVNDQVNGVSRLMDRGASSLAGLVVDFGRDMSTGLTADFDLLISNGTESDRTFTLHGVYDSSGTPLLTMPRTFNLPARNSRLYATTVVDTIGLEIGELHPFADLFGDVFSASGLGRYHLMFSLGAGLSVTTRQFDPFSFDFAARVRPMAYRHAVSVLLQNAQNTTQGGVLNTVTLLNPNPNAMTIGIRAFTEEKGTQYVKTAVTVPARSMFNWSADALGLREDVGDVVSPPVRNFRFQFTSNAPFLLLPRQVGRNASELLTFVTPHIVRLEEE